ncbi:YHYH domain-containing protein [Cysteiniphilum sp. 6C5]
MKKLIFITFIIVLLATQLGNAHSGSTNSSRCHNNHKTGGYHCH